MNIIMHMSIVSCGQTVPRTPFRKMRNPPKGRCGMTNVHCARLLIKVEDLEAFDKDPEA
jgi:hypothetical protein